MNLTLRQLRAFTAVVDAGSFAAAAARLHLTPSALSVLIRELESALGVRLLDRHTRRMLITEAGSDFLPYAQGVLRQLEAAVASMGELLDKRRGRLRVAAPQLMASTLIAAAMARYLAQHPDVEVSLEDTMTDQLVAKVLSGAVDIAVGVEVVADAAITRRKLFRDRHWLVCRPDHALAARRRVRWADLRAHALIAPTRDFMSWVAPELTRQALSLQPAHTSSYMTTALGLAAAGLGVTVIPTYGEPLARANGLTLVPLVAPVFERDVQIYSAPGRSLSPAAQAFVGVLDDVAATPIDPPRSRR